jgi:hypothetical protein
MRAHLGAGDHVSQPLARDMIEAFEGGALGAAVEALTLEGAMIVEGEGGSGRRSAATSAPTAAVIRGAARRGPRLCGGRRHDHPDTV